MTLPNWLHPNLNIRLTIWLTEPCLSHNVALIGEQRISKVKLFKLYRSAMLHRNNTYVIILIGRRWWFLFSVKYLLKLLIVALGEIAGFFFFHISIFLSPKGLAMKAKRRNVQDGYISQRRKSAPRQGLNEKKNGVSSD